MNRYTQAIIHMLMMMVLGFVIIWIETSFWTAVGVLIIGMGCSLLVMISAICDEEKER